MSHSSRSNNGTGVGLYLVKKLTKQMGRLSIIRPVDNLTFS